jgi:hypothetical protein
MWALVLVAGLGACVASANNYVRPPVKVATVESLAAELIEFTTTHDDRGIAHMLSVPLGYGGMWFADTACKRQFAVAGAIPEQGIDLLASCISALPMTRSTRTHPNPNVIVFTYGAGIEVEALLDPADGGHIRWIGYVSRRDLKDALPTVTQDALMALRNDVPPLVLDEPTRAEIQRELAVHLVVKEPGPEPSSPVRTWFKVCIDVGGAVTGVHARLTTSVAAQEAFAAWIKTWTFQPFKLGEQPSPVCSLVVVDENGPIAGTSMPPTIPSDMPEAAVVMTPHAFGDLVAGSKLITPSPDDMTKIRKQRTGPITAQVFYCIDPIGQVDYAKVMATTELPDYDRRLADGVLQWKFAPYVVRGAPVRGCTFVTFKYNQKG